MGKDASNVEIRSNEVLTSFSFSNARYHSEQFFYDELWQISRIEEVLKQIDNEAKVLDVGCYDGTFLELMKPITWSLYGIEGSQSAVEAANKKGLNVTRVDLERAWDYAEKNFDIIYIGEVIEHIVDTDHLINEVHRRLKPGGKLIITTPNLASFAKRVLLFFGKNPYQEASFTFPERAAGHLREYTADLLQQFIENKGFTHSQTRSDILGLPQFVPSKIQRYLGKKFPSLGRSLIMTFKKN
jgi:methionine biosynthesis protein MetW